MTVFFTCLAVGLLVGYRGWLPERALAWTGRITTGGLYLLLFTMGAKIGTNPAILNNLGSLGWQAAVLAVAAVTGSILVLHLVEQNWLGFAGRGEGEGR